MKRGFTLVEVLLSIILISLITVSSFFYVKTEKDIEEVVEFKNTLKLSANVYLEDIKLDSNRTQIIEPNDCIYLKLEDFVSEGLIKEEDDNPVMNDTIKNSGDSIVKIYMNEDYEIDVEYPATDMTIEDYDIPVIVLNNNTDDYNKDVLPNSYEILNLYKSDTSIINKIKNGNYTDWVEPGKKLMNAKGEIINTVDDDWIVSKSWNSVKREWTYTYKINNSGPSTISNKDEIKSVNRIVKLIDDSHPVLVDRYNNYSEYAGEEITMRSYYGYIDPYYYDDYIKFDNFDGITYYPFLSLDIFDYSYTYGLLSKNITLTDTATPVNKKDYTLNISVWENTYPEVYYYGDTWFYDTDLESYDFSQDIECYDYDGDYCYIGYDLYYLDFDDYYYEDSGDYYGDYYYEYWYYYSYQRTDYYTLSYWAYDDYDGYIENYVSLENYYEEYYDDYYYEEYYYEDPWYDDYYYEDDYYDDWYCDDACIIEHMQENSDAWWGADDEERDRLHEENEWWSDQLSDDVWYDDGSGYWYGSDGDILYGDSYDPYYDDYYYDDYYYDDYYGDYYEDYWW